MITTKNPYTGKTIKEYQSFASEQISQSIEKAHLAQREWSQSSYAYRSTIILKIADVLERNKEQYARQMTLEMGKPISQARAELDKCAWLCRFYAHKAPDFLTTEDVATDFYKSYVRYEPLGVLFAVMPWNYPFWQVMRFIIPALMAGNVGILKHASSVMGCALLIEQLLEEAGVPQDCFHTLVIGSDKVEEVIRHPLVKAVTLTGSKPAGSAVASIAGEEIKKTVLELGGSNALVVFPDVDIAKTVEICVQARYQNTGQSCIAGKRLLLHRDIHDAFIEEFTKQVTALKSGDPMDDDTYIGVMARKDLAVELEDLMNQSISMGATLHYGGRREDAFFEPTILTQVTHEMPVFKEETFGPLMAITSFSETDEVVGLVNQSDFGLGVSLFSNDLEFAERLVPRFKDGAVFINAKVASHPALPFGGTGISGYGRELSHHGIREFCNIKTVVIEQ